MKNMLLVLLCVILLGANIFGIIFIYHWASPYIFQEREATTEDIATEDIMENPEITSSESVENQKKHTNAKEETEFKIVDMDGDFVARYNQVDLHMLMVEKLIREQLGEPDKVLDNELVFDLSEDQPTKITELHYTNDNNNLILHIHKQTSQLIGVRYYGELDILGADWWNGIREPKIDVEFELIHSKSNKQSLTIDRFDSTAFVELTPNLTIFTINNSDVYIDKQNPRQNLYIQEQEKIYEDGYLVVKRGETIYLDSKRYRNSNSFSLAVIPESFYREGYTHYVSGIGNGGQPEIVELPEAQFTNRMEFSHNIVLSITPNNPEGVIILPGDTVQFDMYITAAPNARPGVYEAIARFVLATVSYSGRINYPGFGGWTADEIQFKVKVVE